MLPAKDVETGDENADENGDKTRFLKCRRMKLQCGR